MKAYSLSWVGRVPLWLVTVLKSGPNPAGAGRLPQLPNVQHLVTLGQHLPVVGDQYHNGVALALPKAAASFLQRVVSFIIIWNIS